MVSLKVVNSLGWAKSQVMGQESKMQHSRWVGNAEDKSEARLRASGTQDGCLRAGRCLGQYILFLHNNNNKKPRKGEWIAQITPYVLVAELRYKFLGSQHRDLSLFQLQENIYWSWKYIKAHLGRKLSEIYYNHSFLIFLLWFSNEMWDCFKGMRSPMKASVKMGKNQ